MDRRAIAAERKRQATATYYKEIAQQLHEWSEEGISQDDQAGMLNAEGKVTQEGRPFNQIMVSRILKRAIELGQIPQPTF